MRDVGPELEGLVSPAFGAWELARTQNAAAACAAMPILFFGDADAYIRSPQRIITVGLNPSHEEFPEDDQFRRFREAGIAAPGLADPDGHARYLRALSSYFKDDPYSWFGTYKGLLEGIDASFYQGATSTALHTDICSPVATNPTWSRLPEKSKGMLIGSGRGLWHDLVRALRPHVMLISVARKHLDQISFDSDSDWAELCRVEREHPYIVKQKQFRLDDSASTTVVFGPAAQTPFGAVSHEDKRRIERAVADLLASGLSITLEQPDRMIQRPLGKAGPGSG